MALLEKEAIRFAESLDDYEHVSVTDIGGWGPQGSGSSSVTTVSDWTTRFLPTATTGTSSGRWSISSSTSAAWWRGSRDGRGFAWLGPSGR